MRVGLSVILLLVLFVSGAWAEDGAAVETALGLTRADRRLIQSSLAAQGFDPGPADGVFGRRTRAAIGQWQAARGEEPTGYLNAEAAKSLLGRAPQTQETTMTRESLETALGLTRADRRLIQSSLAAQGFDPGPADGVFGRRTRAAISQWQAARGEEPTGYLNAEAAKSLLALGTKPARQPEVTAEPDVSEQDRQAEAEAERQRRERQPGARLRDCETCPQLVVVPLGSFMMGSPDSEWGRFNNESPQRRVTIAEPFAVSVYEVTFGEWDACVNEGGCNGYQPHGEGWGRGGRPVINVSWDDARAYVKWLSQRTGKRYRLLSESEWEYVARAGTMEPFHTGATISADQANYDSSYTYVSGQKGRYRGARYKWVRFRRMPLASMRCMATYGNGRRTAGMRIIRAPRQITVLGKPENVSSVCCAADPGVTCRGFCARPTAARTNPAFATPKSDSVLPGRSARESVPCWLARPCRPCRGDRPVAPVQNGRASVIRLSFPTPNPRCHRRRCRSRPCRARRCRA